MSRVEMVPNQTVYRARRHDGRTKRYLKKFSAYYQAAKWAIVRREEAREGWSQEEHFWQQPNQNEGSFNHRCYRRTVERLARLMMAWDKAEEARSKA